MDKEVREYWEDFCAEHGIEKDVPVEAWAFGIGGKQADYLAELVNRGKRRPRLLHMSLTVLTEKRFPGRVSTILFWTDGAIRFASRRPRSSKSFRLRRFLPNMHGMKAKMTARMKAGARCMLNS